MPEYTALAAKDSYMTGVPVSHKDNNYGGQTVVIVGVAFSGEDKSHLRRSIVNFDVSALAGRTINSAKLVRDVFNSSGDTTIRVSRCTRPDDWVENEVTWNEYSDGNAWTSGGGDFDDTGPPAAIDAAETSGTGWLTITGLEDFVDDAIDNRDGIVSLILRITDEAPDEAQQRQWRSMNHGLHIWRLIVDHDGDPVDNVRRIERRELRGAGRGVLRGT